MKIPKTLVDRYLGAYTRRFFDRKLSFGDRSFLRTLNGAASVEEYRRSLDFWFAKEPCASTARAIGVVDLLLQNVGGETVTFFLRGWLFDLLETIQRIELMLGEVYCTPVVSPVARGDVATAFPGQLFAVRSGFFALAKVPIESLPHTALNFSYTTPSNDVVSGALSLPEPSPTGISSQNLPAGTSPLGSKPEIVIISSAESAADDGVISLILSVSKSLGASSFVAKTPEDLHQVGGFKIQKPSALIFLSPLTEALQQSILARFLAFEDHPEIILAHSDNFPYLPEFLHGSLPRLLPYQDRGFQSKLRLLLSEALA